MLTIHRFKKELAFKILIAISISSLILSHYLSQIEKSSSFFLIQTRCWQILIGAGAALYLRSSKYEGRFSKGKYRTLVELLALAMIAISTIFFSENLPLPGLLSLLPTLGACLVIVFCSKDSFLGKILSCKPLVTIGLMSYSIYLWHQPIFAFGRRQVIDYSLSLGLILIFFTLILAYLTWRWVELPFRRFNNRKRVFAFGFLSTICIFFSWRVL